MYRLDLLKVKHWQLFLFFYALPLFYQIILIVGIGSSIIVKGKPDLDAIIRYSALSPLIVMVPVLVLLYWFWSVGVGLNDKLSVGLRLKAAKFKFYLTFIALFFIAILIFIRIFINSWGVSVDINNYLNNNQLLLTFSVFLILSVFFMFCLFYSFYFVAKTFKTAELQEKVNFSDYISEFLLIFLLFPVGVWFIQPRINKLVER